MISIDVMTISMRSGNDVLLGTGYIRKVTRGQWLPQSLIKSYESISELSEHFEVFKGSFVGGSDHDLDPISALLSLVFFVGYPIQQ